MPTMLVRPGCVTGVGHAAVPLHGFLSYLVKCAVHKKPYTIIGYQGKQVRDNIAGSDLATAFLEWFCHPKEPGSVYNLGGGRESNCSILEAIADCERLLGRPMDYCVEPTPRIGDHIWFIGDDRKWCTDFPNWKREFNHKKLLETMVAAEVESAQRDHSMSK
jgi:CDP-paratose 2-epimerase